MWSSSTGPSDKNQREGKLLNSPRREEIHALLCGYPNTIAYSRDMKFTPKKLSSNASWVGIGAKSASYLFHWPEKERDERLDRSSRLKRSKSGGC
jgi:hypothetical protein